MATVLQPSPGHWVVHLAGQSDSEVTVELRMSEALAGALAGIESARIPGIDSRGPSQPAGNVGSAVLTILSSVLAVGRIKERLSTENQQDLTALIDDEAAAVRANRP